VVEDNTVLGLEGVANLFMHGGETTTGAYNHLTWDINQKANSTHESSILTSVHESFHSDLNNSSAYGLILIVVAYLARETQDEGHINSLISLVEGCRTGHELYATYMSLLAMSREQSSEIDLKLLASYPDYVQYVELGEQIVGSMRGDFLQKHALAAVVKLCFQTPFVEALTAQGLKHYDFADMPEAHYPDRRLESILPLLTADFWSETIFDFMVEHVLPHIEHDTANYLLEDRYDFDSLPVELYDRLSIELTHHLEKAVCRIFVDAKIAVLTGMDHLNYLDTLLNQADAMYSFDDAKVPLMRHEDPSENIINTLRSFEGEILRTSDIKLRADVVEFESLSRTDWEHYLIQDSDKEYFFVVSRIVEKLLDQYSFSAESLALLDGHEFVVCLRKYTVSESGAVIRLCLMSNPKQLTVLDRISKKGMLANSSMCLMSYRPWNEHWQDVLNKACTHTLLFDLSPFEHIGRTLAQVYTEINVRKVSFNDRGTIYTALVLICEGSMTGFYFILCSEMCANSIVYMVNEALATKAGNESKFVSNPLEKDSDYHLVIKRTLMHLYREELVFDFASMSTLFAKKAIKEQQFYQLQFDSPANT